MKGEPYLPSSASVKPNTTVRLSQPQRLSDGRQLQVGTVVTISGNTMKATLPDGTVIRGNAGKLLQPQLLLPNYSHNINKRDFSERISFQKQKRHIKESAEYGKSYLNSYDDAQAVLDAYKDGTARVISVNSSKNEVLIEVKNITGTYVNQGNPKGKPDIIIPTNIFLIQSIKSPKVVPVNPGKGD